MLLWALIPANPYAYYILLRWLCCAIFAYLTVEAILGGRYGWVWILGATAIIYNPFTRVHLTREIWSIVNVATIAVAIVSIFALEHRKQ